MNQLEILKQVIDERIAETSQEHEREKSFERRIWLDGQISAFRQCAVMMDGATKTAP